MLIIAALSDFVAQLVEQVTLNHWVQGSIPCGVIKKRKPRFLFEKVVFLLKAKCFFYHHKLMLIKEAFLVERYFNM